MRKSLRILHTADSHIGAGLPARPRHAWPRRGDDFIVSFRRVIRHAFEYNVDFAIHAGDVFDRSQPSARALTAAAEPLLELAVNGIPVVIVPGNHERSTIPSTVFLAHPNIYIAAEPRTFSFDLGGARTAVSALPCLRRDAAKTFPRALEATGWSKVQADRRILALHQTFESATCGPGNFRFRSSDDVVERSAVPQAFDYVAAGHVHRHQVLAAANGDGPPIVYAGSPDRISFAELSEPKGCVLIEVNDNIMTPTFLEHDVRPMSIWPVDVTGLTRGQIQGEVEQILESLPPRAIAQVRMSGCSAAGSLRSLGFTALAREVRPDVLLTVLTRAVEYRSWRDARRRTAGVRSVFAQLHAPHEQVVRASAQDVKRLPTGRGVYAMYDRQGRVLYIGKSNKVRARARAHLRGVTGANFFRGWSRQIAEIEVRPASSDFEALLIEAELIRRSRPPFNRQMRRWRDYCYLRENGKPHRQLEVCDRPCPGNRCFGPFRSRHLAESVSEAVAEQFQLALCPQDVSDAVRGTLLANTGAVQLCRRYYQDLCCGPCAGRVGDGDYDSRIAGRDALLRGEDDSVVRDLELEVELPTRAGCTDNGVQRLRRRAMTMRMAFTQAETLREAERLVDGLLLLPGPPGCRTTATLTHKGVRFDVLRNDPGDATQILTRHRRWMRRTGSSRIRRLPTVLMDGLCIAVRQLRHAPELCRLIPPLELARLDEKSLLAITFGPDKESHML